MRAEKPGIGARHCGGAHRIAFTAGLAVLLLLSVAAVEVSEVTLRVEGMT